VAASTKHFYLVHPVKHLCFLPENREKFHWDLLFIDAFLRVPWLIGKGNAEN
jgi:hypothetical protein